MAYRVRTVRDLDELRLALGSIGHYFGWQPSEEDAQRFSQLLPLDRMHAAFDDGALIGGAGAFPFRLSVPGGEVPCAGVTVVGVLPTHRRRGLLKRMMAAQLTDVAERGEPLAALWASEETIYGRYGYGMASLRCWARLPRVWSALRGDLPPPDGRVRLVGHDEALATLPRLYDRVRRANSGFLSRSRVWWELRTLEDSRAEWRSPGVGPLNRALLERDGRPVGYALYRFVHEGPAAERKRNVRVIEAMGVDSAAVRDVWRFLLSVDWTDEIEGVYLPVDHPLLQLVARVSRLNWQVIDGLWVRLVDVPAALAARSYDGDAVIEVTEDAQFPANVGRWSVGARVGRVRRRPHVRVDVQALASAYLGGFSFTQLARGGRAEEVTRGGLERADAAFRTSTAPWCPENF